MRIKRFTVAQRLFHLLLVICFLFLAATGISRLYIETAFGQAIAFIFGGYAGALAVHKFFGVLLLILFAFQIAYVLFGVRSKIAGPDSLLPRRRDLGDFFRHLAWMLGIKKHPAFERWGYWEKFDYWAVFWGIFVIGGTGIMLYDPVATSRAMPGWSLNVALWIHRIEALLAMAHVFVIHFLVAHLRRSSFPMDETMMSGTADIEIVREERGDWIGRLEREGRLGRAITGATHPAAKATMYTVGLFAIAVGLILLVGGIVNAPAVTW